MNRNIRSTETFYAVDREDAMRQPSVLIAGAGLGGLSTAVFLGLHGVDTLVVERHAGLSTQPKARGQMPATTEALAAAGLAGQFAAAAPPGRHEMKIVIAESVTGKALHSFTEAMPDFSRFSPQRDGLVSQQRAERILADRAVELGVAIRFNTELESFKQDHDEVIVRVRDRGTGEPATISAPYLVGADGHKGTVRAAAGIGVHGRQRGGPAPAMFASFDADLRPALGGAATGLWHVQNAALPHGNATVLTTDNPGRLVVGGGFSAADAEPRRLIEHIRTAAGVPDLEVRNLDIAWTSSDKWITRVADTFRAGRVLLAGDAAHVMPGRCAPTYRVAPAQEPGVKSIRSANLPRPTRTTATICGGNRPWATTPGVDDNRTASAAGSSTGPW
jgi:2-polyprenyl-6-methoxyphenol hydroxylase-like FAD-dependent oxidoreductase